MAKPAPNPLEALAEAYKAEVERRAAEFHLAYATANAEQIREESKTLLGFVKHAWHVLEPNTPLLVEMPVEAICEHLQAVSNREINRLWVNVAPGNAKSLLLNVLWPAYEWGPLGRQWLRYVATSGDESLTTRDGKKFRDLVTSPWYKQLWPEVEMTSLSIGEMNNTKTGARYGVPFSGMTGWRGDRLCIDDPHNLKNEKSDAMRQETVRLFRESASSRLNDVTSGAIVGVMQMVGPDDLSNYVKNDSTYTYLCIPQEFERERKCITYRKNGTVLWEDPRKNEGELASPKRFPREWIEKEKSPKEGIGPYAFCTPGESPILMEDLSMKPIRDVRVGDTVVGFTTDKTAMREGEKFSRPKLVKSKVVDISASVQRVVKLTLDSGRTVRCTENHKWYTRRGGEGRRTYAPAKVGSKLWRVCDPELPKASSVQEVSDAGWLAGFFDGEGSVSIANRRHQTQPRALITFTQTSGANLALCEKFEKVAKSLGFDFGCIERDRSDCEEYKNWQSVRWYWLRGRSLPLAQRFLHLVGPVKWRQRIIDCAYTAQFLLGGEKVVSIEPDGEETVYGLTTETGNYVVWGLASSNSAQHQQNAISRLGGMFEKDWFKGKILKPWELEKFNIVRTVRWFDLADTDIKASKTGGARTAGVKIGMTKNREFIVLHSKAFGLSGAKKDAEIKRIVDMDPQNVEICFPADPASGGKVQGRAMATLCAGRNVKIIKESGDKVARAEPFSSQCEAGNVFLLEGNWNEEWLDEVCMFPKIQRKDIVDASANAFNHLMSKKLVQPESWPTTMVKIMDPVGSE